MTMAEFKDWLLKFDSNGDGKISRDELRWAIKNSGGWFSGWKSSRAIRSADLNGNGCIDEDEISGLVRFAHKLFGIKIKV